MATASTAEQASFEEFLQAEQQKDLLRFTTAGSVDDGKSTLIGRLLYDSRNVYDDQIESVTKASVGRNAGAIDFSLLTDGLRAEREQGITIDVAYRYFATPRRKFIIADTPGHEQYTRNMVTGASTAELAIILIDARKGMLPQSKRHAYIASLLGLPHVAVAVNKMDLVDYSESVYREIERDFRSFLAQFDQVDPYFIPLSALAGDNVVTRSDRMPWYDGVSLIEHLETVPVGRGALRGAFRFPVQRIVRPNLDFRGYAGQMASGTVRPGDSVTILPSGRSTKVRSIVTFDGNLAEARVPQSVTLTLEDEIDIVRGDLIVDTRSTPSIARLFDATLVWLNEEPMSIGKRYRLKHTTHQEWAEVKLIHHATNINTLAQEPASEFTLNQIGSVRIETSRALYFDPYKTGRSMGSFVLIDAVTNATVAAGMISGVARESDAHGGHKHVPGKGDPVSSAERAARWKHQGAVIQLGNRRELAEEVDRQLFARGAVSVLFEEWDPAWAKSMVASGILVLVVSKDPGEIGVISRSGRIAIDPAALNGLTAEAARTVVRTLEAQQILLSTELWSESDGI